MRKRAADAIRRPGDLRAAIFTPRRARSLRVASRRWQRRLVFVLGGIAVGAAASVFALLADLVQSAFRAAASWQPLMTLPLTAAGFALCAWVTRRFFPNTQGSGIPQVIAARHLREVAARERLVSLRASIGKIGLTALGLLCGASAGREGPTVQVGASIMLLVGRMSPGKQPGLLLAGAAAGVAAAFNTPLAGIVFGIEEMSRSFEVRTSGIIIGAVIAAGLTAIALRGDYTYFGTTAAMLANGADWLAIPLCGIAGGLLGGLFSRIVIEMSRGLPGVVGAALGRHPILLAAGCGLAVAILGLVSGDFVQGTGYAEVRGLLEGRETLSGSYAITKLGATLLTAVSGIPGGIFAPSLAVGAGIGRDVAQLFPGAPVGAIVLLGIVGYFAGVVQAPLTAFVIVEEMTANHQMIVPLAATALVAHATSRLICREGIYHALARGFIRRAQPSAARPH